jgi:hypothetical protein
MRDIAVVIAAVVVAVLGFILLCVVFIHAIQLTWNLALSLSESLVALAGWLLNAIVFVALAGGLVVAVLLAGLAAVLMFKALERKVIELVDLNREVAAGVKKLIAGKPDKFAPVVIAGVVQCLILVLKDSAVTPAMKVLLSVAVWTLATLLNLALAEWKWNRTFGKWAIFLMVLVPLGVAAAAVAYLGFFEPAKFDQEVEAVREWLGKQSPEDIVAGAMIVLFILLMPVAAFILYRGRRSASPAAAG